MNADLLMDKGIRRIAERAARFYMGNESGRRFLTRQLPRLHRAARVRRERAAAGLHVPPMLIASIASRCNLHCAGCYARAGGDCGDREDAAQLDAGEWGRIFREAAALGVSFVLLAGGEPLLRRDVLEAAAACPELIFPVFTNGTVMDGDNLRLFDAHRNLLPVLSLEGGREETDRRRGDGIYAQIAAVMAELHARGVLYGASLTVTTDNLHTVTDAAFLAGLREQGCGMAFLVEYVPVQAGTAHLALQPEQHLLLQERSAALKRQLRDMIVVSFPGDEAAMGGCLAAGRGFFHINAAGGAEPCPFAPYSRHSLKTSTISDVLESGFFAGIKIIAGEGEHTGGCTLFDRREAVEAYLSAAHFTG